MLYNMEADWSRGSLISVHVLVTHWSLPERPRLRVSTGDGEVRDRCALRCHSRP